LFDKRQPLFERAMKLKRIIIIAGVVNLVTFITYLVLRPHPITHSTASQTNRRFLKIGGAINHFAWDHQDQLPEKLSDVVPRYVSLDQLSLFYPPEMLIPSTNSAPAGWDHNAEIIDTSSDCVYLGAAGMPREIIAYERKEKWNNAAGAYLRVITPGGGVHMVTESELNELLHSDESAKLEWLRKERVTYYEANLHASLNGYRIDFGSYPRGDNASVISVLCGNNPPKKQYHGGYEQKRNPHGEDLDPWGTPYLIESDGDTVRVKSAGGNRKFDRPGSTNYDDMCLSVTKGSVISDDTKF
jgi:hypothetical protein